MKNSHCMVCRSGNVTRFLDLGAQPNGNHFPSAEEFEGEPRFPFAMAVCEACWEVQIEEFPSVEFMFANHPYITGVNMPVVAHFDKLVRDTLQRYPFPDSSLVFDIGCNDGTLLKKFESAGMRVLGIDPGKRTGELARRNGVTVCETFWDEQTASAFVKLGLRPDLITATAVFYHVADIHSFVKGLSILMHERSVFVAQCVYLKDVIEKLQFDHFYHEHTMIHALSPLQGLFKAHGLRMLDVEFYDVHGGSFVLFVGREESPYPTKDRIADAIASENAAGLQNLETFQAFAKSVQKNRDDLLNLLRELRAAEKTVFALGAPLKGSTLLNYCGIGPELVTTATEVNRFKIGRYTPGTHIPIVHEDSVTQQPDYYLVLSWNFLPYFIGKYASFLRAGGKFIVPHPAVRIVGAEALNGPESLAR